jgi:hypothetical protein
VLAITASAAVDRPADEVYAYATDPTRFSEWQQGVVSGHMELRVIEPDEEASPTAGHRSTRLRDIDRPSC